MDARRAAGIMALGLALSSPGCASVSVPDPVIPIREARHDVLIYRDGRPIRTGSLPGDSAGANALETLLAGQKGRWRPDLNSYAPGIAVRSKSANINLHNDRIIVNADDGKGRPRQSSSTITEEEYREVSRAIAASLADETNAR